MFHYSKFHMRFTACGRNMVALAKLNELNKLVEGFSSKIEYKMASEFVTGYSCYFLTIKIELNRN